MEASVKRFEWILSLVFISVAASGAISGMAWAQNKTYSLTITESGFSPRNITVAAGTKFKLVVKNATKKAAEFESAELNREKVIPAGASATVYIGPLSSGNYPFFDEFTPSRRGAINAR